MVDELSQEFYAAKILNLAKAKGYGNDTDWLLYGCHKEVGELTQAIESYLAGKLRFNCKHCRKKKVVEQKTRQCLVCHQKFLDSEIYQMYLESVGSEFAGIIHYVDQLIKKHAPEVNLDIALLAEIEKNYKTEKKTYDKGKIVNK